MKIPLKELFSPNFDNFYKNMEICDKLFLSTFFEVWTLRNFEISHNLQFIKEKLHVQMLKKFSIPVSFCGTISFSFPTFCFVFFVFSSAKSTNLAKFLDSKTNNQQITQIWYQDSESSPDLVFSLCLHSIPQSGLEASAPLLGRGKYIGYLGPCSSSPEDTAPTSTAYKLQWLAKY